MSVILFRPFQADLLAPALLFAWTGGTAAAVLVYIYALHQCHCALRERKRESKSPSSTDTGQGWPTVMNMGKYEAT